MKYRFSGSIAWLLWLTSILSAGQLSPRATDFLNGKLAELNGAAPAANLKIEIDINSELPPAKCGTPITLATFYALRNGNDEALRVLVERPGNLPLTFASTHFLVHYTDTGTDAPYQVGVDVDPADGVPDYINRVSEVFEYVWQTEINNLGYNGPPSDQGLGGDDRYDVYMRNLGFGYFGFTTPESVVMGYRAYSYIEIENDFAESSRYRNDPVSGLSVTAAHEFFHAIQFGYDAFEFDAINPNDPATYKPWWLEASSTWMEDIVYDEINDYRGYLRFFYKNIWMSLTTFSYGGDARAFHPYASCVWPIFLSEKYQDPGLIKDIWIRCGEVQGYNTLPATDEILRQRGNTLENAFLEFEIWNFHTGALADTLRFFSEGSYFPEAETTAYVSDLTSVSPYTISGAIAFPEHFATNYIVIQSYINAPGGIIVDFNGQNIANQEWHAALLGYKAGDSRWQDMQVNPSTGDGSDAWIGWNSYRSLVLLPTVAGLRPDYSTFSYTGIISYDPTLVGEGIPGLNVAQAYPSPFIISGSDSLHIPYSLDKSYSKKDLSMSIYSVSGEKVCEIPGERFSFTDPGEYKRGVQWDGRNSNNEYVASGIYIYLFDAKGHSSKGKIAVINQVK